MNQAESDDEVATEKTTRMAPISFTYSLSIYVWLCTKIYTAMFWASNWMAHIMYKKKE